MLQPTEPHRPGQCINSFKNNNNKLITNYLKSNELIAYHVASGKHWALIESEREERNSSEYCYANSLDL